MARKIYPTGIRPGSSGTIAGTSFVNWGSVTAPVTLPFISGAHRASSVLTVDESAVGTVASRVWIVDGVEQVHETGITFNPVMLMNSIVEVECTKPDGSKHKSPGFRIYMDHAHASHNMNDDALLALLVHTDLTHAAVKDGAWSDPATWNTATVPGAGARVLVSHGKTVTYDVSSSPRLDRLRLDGTLTFALDRSTQLHVETVIGQAGSELIIGNSDNDRLPPQYTCEIIISDRSYVLSSVGPTDLNTTQDPMLMSRGIITNGLFRTFGAFVTPYAKTFFAPEAGDTSVTLQVVPVGWEVGGTIVVPATRHKLSNATDGSSVALDEERVITAISGNVVSFASPLLEDHDHYNAAVTRTDLQPAIAYKDRNIIIRSENTTEDWYRGHTMAMHMTSQLDLWSTRFLNLGRTNKNFESGIKDGADFRYVDLSTYNTTTTPLTAQSNVQSRYPVHGHFMGFGREVTPLIRDCHIEHSPGWLAVHHGCEMDWFNNTMHKFGGAGFVSETGDEIGAWVGNFVFGHIGTRGHVGTPKTQESLTGAQQGDFGVGGHPFFMRGRALRVNSNIAASGSWAFVFYHRGDSDTVSDFINIKRGTVDLNDLAPLKEHAEIRIVDYPIVHFADNECFGCYGGFFVTKADPAQHHDLNINLKRFKAWGVAQGGNIQYVGKYAATDFDLVGINETEAGLSFSETTTGIELGPNSQQIALVRATIEGFQRAVLLTASSIYSPLSEWNDTNEPMFMVVAPTLIGNGTDYVYSGGAETVRRIWATEPTYIEVSHNIPFDIGTWNGNGGTTANTMSNMPTGLVKTDTVGDQAFSGKSAAQIWGDIGNAWDPAGISANRMGSSLEALVEADGYVTVGSDNYVLIVNYYSDRLTTRPIKTLHGVKIDPSVDPAAEGWVNQGPLTLTSTPPSRDDITQAVTQDTTTTVDVLTATTVAPGATASLEIAYYGADHGKAYIDGGNLVYKPDPGYTGDDEVYAWVHDGDSGYDTVHVQFSVT